MGAGEGVQVRFGQLLALKGNRRRAFGSFVGIFGIVPCGFRVACPPAHDLVDMGHGPQQQCHQNQDANAAENGAVGEVEQVEGRVQVQRHDKHVGHGHGQGAQAREPGDEKLQKDQNFAVDAYDALQPYLTTSMAKGQLVNEAWAAKDYTRLDTIKPDGTYQVGEDGFMEFYPDADALQQAVLQLFYEKVE